jgi:aminoglycoside/choline kinase family phosphotransferase
MTDATAMSRATLIDTFLTQRLGAYTSTPIPGDASFRRYARLSCAQHGGSAILMDAPPEKEDVRPFMLVAEYLLASHISAPRIFAADPENGLLLLEDLGPDRYAPLLAEGREGISEAALYHEAVEVLIHLQSSPLPEHIPPYSEAKFLEEVALFADWFLPTMLPQTELAGVRTALLNLWRGLLPIAFKVPDAVVLRDYHADNLHWMPERRGIARVGVIDFQDALIGPVTYDLVSLLEDARRDVLPETVKVCKEQAFRAIRLASHVSDADIAASYAVMGAQRNMKIIGIFHRLATRDQKPAYLRFLPRVWGHLATDCAHPALSPLRAWLEGIGVTL